GLAQLSRAWPNRLDCGLTATALSSPRRIFVSSRVVWFFSAVALVLVFAPRVAAAQDSLYSHWEIPGFDFRPNGAWRVRAQQISAYRRQLIANRNFGALNAPMARTPGGAQGPAHAIAATPT